jgi:hypothetical protein
LRSQSARPTAQIFDSSACSALTGFGIRCHKNLALQLSGDQFNAGINSMLRFYLPFCHNKCRPQNRVVYFSRHVQRSTPSSSAFYVWLCQHFSGIIFTKMGVLWQKYKQQTRLVSRGRLASRRYWWAEEVW